MNSHTLKITGLSELEKPLEIGKSYDIHLQGDCISITKTDMEDGSFSFTHKIKQRLSEITSDNGERIVVKDIKKQSQKLRLQLGFIARERGIDEGEFYEKKMIAIRHYLMEILDLIESYENK